MTTKPTVSTWPERVYGIKAQTGGSFLGASAGLMDTIEVTYTLDDLITAREQELNSKISDLEILLDNCRVGAVYSDTLQKEREQKLLTKYKLAADQAIREGEKVEELEGERIKIVQSTLDYVADLLTRKVHEDFKSSKLYKSIDPATILNNMKVEK